MRQIERLKDRIMAGMSYEAAYGLEYMLARRDEGFNGRTWSKQDSTGPAKETLANMVSIMKLIRREPLYINQAGRRVGIHQHKAHRALSALIAVQAAKVVDVCSKHGRLIAPDVMADEFMDEHDTQKSMFD